MDKITFMCLLYTMLLIIPGPILGLALAKTKAEDEKRQAQVLLPLASYAGLSVTGPLFLALVAAYGVYAVINYGIKSDHDSHSCANNRGWCRAVCHSNEQVDNYHSDICGAYKCCRHYG
ncbi:big defensin-like isoform X1 [Mytilus trossulus]|uniref:big defensin-like isoform X1 n=1 Tax=Mytilus trossulus TaxID=6551 RepID=UPI0030052B00